MVVTIPSLGGYEISDYGYQLGRAWGIGQKSLNNGILFIVAPTEHKTRIEVGYGLEPIVTDALSSVIIQTQVLPQFRKGDFNGGVEAGADALIQQLSLDTSEAEKRAAAAAQPCRKGGDQRQHPIGAIIVLLFIAFVFVAGVWRLGLAAVPVHGRRARRRLSVAAAAAGRAAVAAAGRAAAAAASAAAARRGAGDAERGRQGAHQRRDHRGRSQDVRRRFSACWRGRYRAIAKCRCCGRRWRRFIVPPLLVLAGLHRLALASIFSSWTDDSARAMEGLILRALTTYGLVQAGLFACVAMIVALPAVRRVLTPGSLRQYRVRQAARRHFVAAGAAAVGCRAAYPDFCLAGRPAGGAGGA